MQNILANTDNTYSCCTDGPHEKAHFPRYERAADLGQSSCSEVSVHISALSATYPSLDTP